jgi:phosphoacetylglucosamine mutase
MLEAAWEGYATALANAPSTEEFIEGCHHLVTSLKIDISKPAHVLYARDTRPSGPALIKALEDGIAAIGATGRNEGVQTTPMVHYLVRCVNTKGTSEAYGEDTVDGYYTKMANAFRKLMACA